MKRSTLFLILSLFLIIVSCSQPEPEQYGSEITLQETTSIAAIMNEPEDFVGKRVLVEGRVTGVCPKAGCWIELADNNTDQKIRVKVDDGVIVFPQLAKGHMARMEGEVYSIELDHEHAIRYFAHLAEEKGEAFDPASVTGAMTIHQIKGMGGTIAK